jgi:hypothetical protein
MPDLAGRKADIAPESPNFGSPGHKWPKFRNFRAIYPDALSTDFMVASGGQCLGVQEQIKIVACPRNQVSGRPVAIAKTYGAATLERYPIGWKQPAGFFVFPSDRNALSAAIWP